jgi:type III pantothenate kinase
MHLVIDIGNSSLKCGVFEQQSDGNFVLTKVGSNTDVCVDTFIQLDEEIAPVSVMVSSVRKLGTDILDWFSSKKWSYLSSETKTGIKINYESPETLGMDRLAAVVGASYLAEGKNCLVIDAGTCITYDILEAPNLYQGGNIAPGLSMRLKAMNHFTSALPLVSRNDDFELIGKNTETAIRNGAQTGLIMEVNAFIEAFKNKYTDLVIFISGGDAEYIKTHCKHEMKHETHLVLHGLHQILLQHV